MAEEKKKNEIENLRKKKLRKTVRQMSSKKNPVAARRQSFLLH